MALEQKGHNVSPAGRYHMPPVPAIPMTMRNLDPRRPVDPRIHGLSSYLHVAPYWDAPRAETPAFDFGVRIINRGRYAGSRLIHDQLGIISRMRGYDGKHLVGFIDPNSTPWRVATKTEQKAQPQGGFTMSEDVCVVMPPEEPDDITATLNRGLDLVRLHGSGFTILFYMGEYYNAHMVRDGREVRRALRKERVRLFFVDDDGGVEDGILDDREDGVKACLVVFVNGGGTDAKKRLFSLVQMDAAWRLLHLLSPARMERLRAENIPRDLAEDPDFPVELLETIQGFAGTPLEEVRKALETHRTLGEIARNEERRLVDMMRRLSLKRPTERDGPESKERRTQYGSFTRKQQETRYRGSVASVDDDT